MPNNVIGPINDQDWTLMRDLKYSLAWYQQNYAPKYESARQKEKEIYTETMDKYLTRTVN